MEFESQNPTETTVEDLRDSRIIIKSVEPSGDR